MQKLILFLALATTFFFSSTLVSPLNDKLKLPKPIRNNYALIPAGEVMVGEEKSTLEAFYIFKTEVSNLNYFEFLFNLKQKGETEKLAIARIDSSQWLIKGTSTQPFVENYHKHPAYHDYPVVNISLEAAKLYCEWLGETLTRINPGFVFEARLPTRTEWIRAARPEQITAPYSWGGYYLQNRKGQLLCNFRKIGAESIAFDPETKTYVVKDRALHDQARITAPVISYAENVAGLYHMNGNVAELTAEGLACGGSWNSTGYDVRVESVMEVEGPSPFVGFRPVLIIKEK